MLGHLCVSACVQAFMGMCVWQLGKIALAKEQSEHPQSSMFLSSGSH